MDSYLSATTRLTPYEELLSKFFECPVCLSTMFPPIYRCGAGHSICKDCHQRVTTCPRCRLPRINRRAPYPLENISLLLRFPCKYEMEGCEFIGQAKALVIHYKTCRFKPIYCPVNTLTLCTWNDSEKQLANHLLQRHPEKIRVGNFSTFSTILKRRQIPNTPIFMYAFNQVFRIYWQVEAGCNLFKFVVDSMEKFSKERFKYELALLPCHDYTPTCIFAGSCESWEDKERKIYSGENTFMHYKVLREYANEDRKLCYTVTIKKDMELSFMMAFENKFERFENL